MIPRVVELDESIFPEPTKFNPDRWMGPNAVGLEKWAVGFSKGRRQCLAKKLALRPSSQLIVIVEREC